MSKNPTNSKNVRQPLEGELLSKSNAAAGASTQALMHVGPVLVEGIVGTVRELSTARKQIKMHRDSMNAQIQRDRQEGRTAREEIRSNARMQKNKVDQFGHALQLAVETGNDEAVAKLIEAIHATK